MKKIGENIKELREEKRLLQTELAKKVGIGKNYLSDIERGLKNPSEKTIEKIAEVLEVDVPSIRYGKSDEKPQDESLELLYNEVERIFSLQQDKARAAIFTGELIKFIRNFDEK